MIFLYILGAIVLIVVIVGLIAPKDFAVQRSIDINKQPEDVYNYVRFLENQGEWGPWQKKDPNMEKGINGEDGSVGAVSWWKGNKDVGEGEQEIKKLVPNQRMETELRFLKPWKATNDAFIQIDAKENGSSVTWGFAGKSPFPMNVMMLFMNMDKAVGKDFQEGLDNLKNILES